MNDSNVLSALKNGNVERKGVKISILRDLIICDSHFAINHLLQLSYVSIILLTLLVSRFKFLDRIFFLIVLWFRFYSRHVIKISTLNLFV